MSNGRVIAMINKKWIMKTTRAFSVSKGIFRTMAGKKDDIEAHT
jgi:hypothetical protein